MKRSMLNFLKHCLGNHAYFNFISFLGNLEISADIAYGNQLHKANVSLRTLFVKIKNCISQVSVIYPSLFLFFST